MPKTHGPKLPNVFAIDVTNQQTKLPVDPRQIQRAVEMILADASISRAQISVAVVDDPTIHKLNRQYLNHDEATDVLSFVLERAAGSLEGEVIVSADTARSTASRFGWSAPDELLLYVIHGALHLVGYDDATPEETAKMQNQEKHYLAHFGLTPNYAEPDEREHEPDAARTAGPASRGREVP